MTTKFVRFIFFLAIIINKYLSNATESADNSETTFGDGLSGLDDAATLILTYPYKTTTARSQQEFLNFKISNSNVAVSPLTKAAASTTTRLTDAKVRAELARVEKNMFEILRNASKITKNATLSSGGVFAQNGKKRPLLVDIRNIVSLDKLIGFVLAQQQLKNKRKILNATLNQTATTTAAAAAAAAQESYTTTLTSTWSKNFWPNNTQNQTRQEELIKMTFKPASALSTTRPSPTSTRSISFSINLNGRNYSIHNVTEVLSEPSSPPPFDAFRYIDNYAKEIILLSTACATMLLSICFLLFIAWFCYYTVARDRKRRHSQARQRLLEKSWRESEANLSAAGIFSTSNKGAAGGGGGRRNKIAVRDEEKIQLKVVSTTPPQAKTTETKEEKKTENECSSTDAAYYHQYDKLELNNNSKKNERKSDGELNAAFEPDACDQAEIQSRSNQEKDGRGVSSSNQLKPTTTAAQTLSVRRFNRNVEWTKNNSTNSYARISTANGRVEKNQTATTTTTKTTSLKCQPRLNRKQIEREFYEYTLECRRRLNELFAESLSSDSTTPRSSLDMNFNMRSSSNMPFTKRAAAGIVTYSNNFNMLKKAAETTSANSKQNNSNFYSSSSLDPKFRRKKIEIEQIWHI